MLARLITALSLLSATALAAGPVPAKEDKPTQTLMQSILAPLVTVLPLSFDLDEFSSSSNREKIAAHLKVLRDNSSKLKTHAKSKDRAFEFVANSLHNDATRIYRWYARGSYEEAQFALHHMTENCIACHENLPETHKVPPALAFFTALDLEKLPPLDRAQMQVMTRQFDDAMTTYEKVLISYESPTENVLLLQSLTDYLKVAANSKGDLSRPQTLLEKIAAKPGLSVTTKERLAQWVGEIKRISAAKDLQKTDLATARRLVNEGRSKMDFPRDKDGLIPYLTAAAILNRYVHEHKDRGEDVAEAYFLLGTTESLLGRSFWISREEFNFESAIRLAPGAPFARKAYQLLEESYTFGFSGSGGTRIPEDIQLLLNELRHIVEEAQGRRS